MDPSEVHKMHEASEERQQLEELIKQDNDTNKVKPNDKKDGEKGKSNRDENETPRDIGNPGANSNMMLLSIIVLLSAIILIQNLPFFTIIPIKKSIFTNLEAGISQLQSDYNFPQKEKKRNNLLKVLQLMHIINSDKPLEQQNSLYELYFALGELEAPVENTNQGALIYSLDYFLKAENELKFRKLELPCNLFLKLAITHYNLDKNSPMVKEKVTACLKNCKHDKLIFQQCKALEH
jgi:hypothetical protein